MEVYYQNSRGEVLYLTRWPYWMQTGDIINYSWSYRSNTYNRLQGFDRGIQEKTITLTIKTSTPEEYSIAVDEFHRITETDTILNTPGKLYINGSYLQCFVVSSEKTEWESMNMSMDNTIRLITDRPQWVNEITRSFQKASLNQTSNENNNGNFPHDHPYDYARNLMNEEIFNAAIVNSKFRMIIYGGCINPEVTISGHTYKVLDTLEDKEYMVIDSVSKTIIKHKTYGEIENIFQRRYKPESVFAPIPAGDNPVFWNRNFGFDLTLIQERSEPAWS